MLPNFIVIGAMKSGTSSLHRYLKSHPQVFMSENKEPEYFATERNWGRGQEWYESLFAGAGERSRSAKRRPCIPSIQCITVSRSV